MIYKSGKVKNNKAWELQIQNDCKNGPYFDFNVRWNRKCDHAGFTFSFEMLSFMFDFNFYDTRQWDHDNDSYVDYTKRCEFCAGVGTVPDSVSNDKYATKECSACGGYGIKREFQEN